MNVHITSNFILSRLLNIYYESIPPSVKPDTYFHVYHEDGEYKFCKTHSISNNVIYGIIFCKYILADEKKPVFVNESSEQNFSVLLDYNEVSKIFTSFEIGNMNIIFKLSQIINLSVYSLRQLSDRYINNEHDNFISFVKNEQGELFLATARSHHMLAYKEQHLDYIIMNPLYKIDQKTYEFTENEQEHVYITKEDFNQNYLIKGSKELLDVFPNYIDFKFPIISEFTKSGATIQNIMTFKNNYKELPEDYMMTKELIEKRFFFNCLNLVVDSLAIPYILENTYLVVVIINNIQEIGRLQQISTEGTFFIELISSGDIYECMDNELIRNIDYTIFVKNESKISLLTRLFLTETLYFNNIYDKHSNQFIDFVYDDTNPAKPNFNIVNLIYGYINPTYYDSTHGKIYRFISLIINEENKSNIDISRGKYAYSETTPEKIQILESKLFNRLYIDEILKKYYSTFFIHFPLFNGYKTIIADEENKRKEYEEEERRRKEEEQARLEQERLKQEEKRIKQENELNENIIKAKNDEVNITNDIKTYETELKELETELAIKEQELNIIEKSINEEQAKILPTSTEEEKKLINKKIDPLKISYQEKQTEINVLKTQIDVKDETLTKTKEKKNEITEAITKMEAIKQQLTKPSPKTSPKIKKKKIPTYQLFDFYPPETTPVLLEPYGTKSSIIGVSDKTMNKSKYIKVLGTSQKYPNNSDNNIWSINFENKHYDIKYFDDKNNTTTPYFNIGIEYDIVWLIFNGNDLGDQTTNLTTTIPFKGIDSNMLESSNTIIDKGFKYKLRYHFQNVLENLFIIKSLILTKTKL